MRVKVSRSRFLLSSTNSRVVCARGLRRGRDADAAQSGPEARERECDRAAAKIKAPKPISKPWDECITEEDDGFAESQKIEDWHTHRWYMMELVSRLETLGTVQAPKRPAKRGSKR